MTPQSMCERTTTCMHRHGAESPSEVVESISCLEKEGGCSMSQESIFFQKERYEEMEEFAFAKSRNFSLASRSEELVPSSSKRMKHNTNNNSKKRRVSFSHVNLREHNVILGDHPCCEQGLPVTLGWDIQQEQKLNLDYYESLQERRQRRGDFRLSFEDRRQILNIDMISSSNDRDVKHRQRKLLAREQREHRSQHKLQQHDAEEESFFQRKPLSRTSAPMMELEELNALWMQEDTDESTFFVLQ
mmetsp:Transcript_23301/g.35291  ORF Transcript_23301/g.35291 Transcript_23301/m.35291 type:complete len:245 (-) Transcript_23301:316-1050(-)